MGDAENDHAFLESCECSVAVANAIPALKEKADLVTQGERGDCGRKHENREDTGVLSAGPGLDRNDLEYNCPKAILGL